MASDMRTLPLTLAAMLASACGDDSSSATSTDGSTTAVADSGDSGVFTTFMTSAQTGDVTGNVTSISTTAEPTTDTATTDVITTGVTTDATTDATSGGVSTSEASVTSDASATSDASTTDATTSGVSATTDASTTDATTSTTDPTAGTTDTTTGGNGFPDAPPFGSNVLDLDLVGTWNLNWDPVTGADSVIDIDDAGNFTWTESSADCSQSTVAAGYLWVEGSQVVMHVEQWDRQLPWDTEPVLGESFPPPFRLRMSFSLQGTGGVAYLGLGAPTRVVETSPYAGASFIRLTQAGGFIGGTWHGEAQLEAIPAGETDPVVIVRDTYEALLDAESGVDPEGTGTRATNTQYFPIAQSSWVYDGGNWTCLGGCPAVAGTTLVNGSNLYTYGPYGGQTHLLPFESGKTFKRDEPSDCP